MTSFNHQVIEIDNHVCISEAGIIGSCGPDYLSAELPASNMPRLKNLKDLDHYYLEADRIKLEANRVHRRITSMHFSGNFNAMTILRINGSTLVILIVVIALVFD